MEEEKKEEEKKEVEAKPNVSQKISDANAASERMELANKKKEELLAREEEVIAHQALSGKGEAGVEPEKPKEETPKEYKDRVMRGGI